MNDISANYSKLSRVFQPYLAMSGALVIIHDCMFVNPAPILHHMPTAGYHISKPASVAVPSAATPFCTFDHT